MEKEKNKVTEKDILTFIIIATALVLVFFVYVNFVPKSLFKKGISVEIIEIKGECEECFDLKLAEAEITKNNIKLKSTKTFDVNSEKAKELIKKYNIRRIPALIVVSKKIEEVADKNFFSVYKGYAVFEKGVPYTDLSSGEIKGIVDVKEIYDSKCRECFSISQLQDQLKKINIKIRNYEAIDAWSDKGKSLIKENDLGFVPVLLLSENINEYWWFFDSIKGSLAKKGEYYVYENPVPPYKEISTGKIKGKVDVTYLVDKDCIDCIKVEQLRSAFLSLGIYMDNEKSLDITAEEGKNLLKKYNITAVPTIILSKEILDYKVKDILEGVGSFEKNGEYVFRELEQLKLKYKKLS